MGKNQSASNLTNIIKQDASGNIVFTSGSTTLATISTAGQLSGSTAVLSAQTASFVANAQTASFVALAQSASNAVSAATASFANAFTVASTLTAQTLVVQTITSSIDFVTGSTRFGSILGNTHVFSGSVTMNPGGLFVSSSGNVGIGTTSPSFKLDVTGTARIWDGTQGFNIRAFTAGAGYGAIYSTGVTPSNINYALVSNGASTYLNATNDAGMTIDNGTKGIFLVSSGNVGIGTSSPNTYSAFGTGIGLDVASSTTNAPANINIVGNGSGYAGLNLGNATIRRAGIFAEDGSVLTFYTNGSNSGTSVTERMRITSTGRLGLGTTNPGYAMEIAASSAVVGVGLIINDTNGKIFSLRSDASTFIFRDNTAATDRLTITNGGQIIAPFGYQSFKGSVSIAASATATIYTMPQASAADGVYYVYCRLNGGAAIYMASAIVTALAANSELFISNTRTGANVGLSVSGRDIRITNAGFGTFTWQWSILFQPVD